MNKRLGEDGGFSGEPPHEYTETDKKGDRRPEDDPVIRDLAQRKLTIDEVRRVVIPRLLEIDKLIPPTDK